MTATQANISRALSLLDNAVMHATRRNNDARIHAKRRVLEGALLDTHSTKALADVTTYARELFSK